MTNKYKLIGADLSPYSIKVRSYLRFKGIDHQWKVGGPSKKGDFGKYGKLPIVPLLITPEGEGWQDSTPIMDKLEAKFPEPAALPNNTALSFLSQLLEEYGDEWGNKHMFHLRWKAEDDQNSASLRIAETRLPLWLRYIPIANSVIQARIATMVKQRMSGRGWVIGSNENTEARIEASFENLLGLLQAHLATRDYIFGSQPSYADFSLWGQIYNAWTDPTGRKLIEKQFAGVKPWLIRMENPRSDGEYETWSQLQATLQPILEQEVAGTFLPWTAAITRSMNAGEEEVSVEISGESFTHSIGGPQKYHVKSLAVLRQKYAVVAGDAELNEILTSTGCKRYLV